MDEEPAQPPFDYPFDEWHPQIIHFLDLESPSLETVRDCFRLQYSDQAEADWKAARFFPALARMRDLHAADPDSFARLNGMGHTSSRSEPMIRALHEIYSARPDHQLHEETHFGAILQLAQEFHARRQRTFKGRAE